VNIQLANCTKDGLKRIVENITHILEVPNLENKCKLNHPIEDVRNKYESQKEYLPSDMISSFEAFFTHEHTQDILNDVFHLLKKYDLSSQEEREQRNKRLFMVLHNL
jgi:hypothetical protein